MKKFFHSLVTVLLLYALVVVVESGTMASNYMCHNETLAKLSIRYHTEMRIHFFRVEYWARRIGTETSKFAEEMMGTKSLTKVYLHASSRIKTILNLHHYINHIKLHSCTNHFRLLLPN